ncbi:calcineurin-like phosphoesterase family protein [Marinilabilia rubra]|nr:calcineurin-like phosphoesterase family protein [Marinilabilia rubra]
MSWIKKIFLLFVFLSGSLAFAQNSTVSGIVFEDLNENGKLDSNEVGVEGVGVSSLSGIVETDSRGGFKLEICKNDIVFVIKPSGYHFHLNEYNIPKYFEQIYPQGSPKSLNYAGIRPTLPKDTLLFPLIPSDTQSGFRVNMVADPQMPRKREVWFFRETIIPSLLTANSEVTIFLGDIADNNLDVFPHFMGSLKALENPVYAVFGNHDVNYRSPDNSLKAETFRSWFGPDYYAFNYGNTHFVALNTVDYFGWNDEYKKKGSYFGGIDSTQLQWLEQDLALVDENFRIVLLTHIPLHPDYFKKQDLKKIFSLLEDRREVTIVSGHLHQNKSWAYGPELYWNGKSQLRSVIAGSASGSWWSGPYASDSIPQATCVDGSPQGFYQYAFRDDGFNYRFVPAQKKEDYQLRISSPHRIVKYNPEKPHRVVVNVFSGDERCSVKFSIDGGTFTGMKQFTGVDPFVERTHFRRINGDNWSPGISQTDHLWEGELPLKLEPGIHTIKSVVGFPDGKKYSATTQFELVDDGQ